jgi:hypothetical protein
VASQKRRLNRSRPTAEANAAAKIGVVPMIRDTVVALASLSEYTKQIWFANRKRAAAEISAIARRPCTARERSTARTNPAASSAAAV